jgi:lysozyme family protein
VVKLSLPNATRQELEAALFLDPVLDSTVHNFYIVHFWSKVAGDDIPVQSLAEEMFDSAVNLGPERAVRWLQAALNALNRQNKLYPDLKEDGRLGRRSMDALRAFLNRDASSLLYKLLNVQQGAHYLRRTQEDETMEKYIRGWLSRVEVSKRGGLDGPDANQGDEG